MLTRHGNYWGVILLLCIGLITGAVIKSPYFLGVLIITAIMSIEAIGFTIIIGYANQLSLCPAAFYGIGAYASAILTTRYLLPHLAALVIAAVIAGLIAYVLGKIVLALKEIYLGMATIGFGLITYFFLMDQQTFTGGALGIGGIPYMSLAGLVFDTDTKFFYLALIAAILSLVVALNIVNGRFGLALRAIGDSETATETLGINATKYKIQSLVISAVYGSIGGSLYAHYVTFVHPEVFYIDTTLLISVMVIVGGIRSVWGGLLGAALITFLGQALQYLIVTITGIAAGQYELLIYGGLIILVMMRAPDGLAPVLRSFSGRWLKRYEISRSKN